MLKSEKRITPRTTLRESDWPKDPAKRISCNPLRCGGMGGLEVYHSASQSVDGCMYTARSSAAESFREGGGKDMILRSANTAGYELTKTIEGQENELESAEYDGLVSALGQSGACVGANDGFVENLIFGCEELSERDYNRR